jgi:DNA-binding response OmpR family regulator
MNNTNYNIAIVDDDNDSRESLSLLLQTSGYNVFQAALAKEAIAKAKTNRIDLFILDIKLPDMEGTSLLSKLNELARNAIKIMVTGYPTAQNTAQALNEGADAYFTKPVNPDDLIKAIKTKLQERELKGDKKRKNWTQLRIKKNQSIDYDIFSEKTTKELGFLGLNKTQAKVYIGLNALKVASVSEISTLSKVRREQVYRVIPELERRGLVVAKLGFPKQFKISQPEIAMENLAKTKIKELKKEARDIRERTKKLTEDLKNSSAEIDEGESIESLPQEENLEKRLLIVAKKAKQQLIAATSSQELTDAFVKLIETIDPLGTTPVKGRILTIRNEEEAEVFAEVNTLRLLESNQETKKQVEVREVETLPFSMLIVDSFEAVWGSFESTDPSRNVLWTNDKTQIEILKHAFENIWHQS